MAIKVKFTLSNFRRLPLNEKKQNPKPYGIIEFMGGSFLVPNDLLIDSVEEADFIDCKAEMRKEGIVPTEIVDVFKDGKSLISNAPSSTKAK